MTARFRSFVVLADMRTGSNFLEQSLNRIPGLRCWGEAFNRHFVGHAGKTAMAGVSLKARDADPDLLLSAIRAKTDGLPGFRFFHDHDPRVFDAVMADPSCAKIVLDRNPLDSWVSLQIARQTGQWRLGDLKNAKSARVTFDPTAFRAYLTRVEARRRDIQRRLQITGQTAFCIGYDDLGQIDVLNGLATWLGVVGRIEEIPARTKVQNPETMREKVENYDTMVTALTEFDPFGVSRTPDFEPCRGPNVPAYVAGIGAPLLFMPIAGGPTNSVTAWLGALDGGAESGLTQKALRKWKRTHPGHRSFAVLRHPLDRAHAVFCRQILMPGPDCLTDLRAALRDSYDLPIPDAAPDADWDIARHRAAFLAFLRFVKGNLAGQTSLPTAPVWATQAALVKGLAQFIPPDRLFRERDLATDLANLAYEVGIIAPPYAGDRPDCPYSITEVADDTVIAAIRDVYRRDFVMFGFADRT